LHSCSTETPSENYWQLLAEKRRIALEECLQENKTLHERVQLLEEEKQVTEQMLEESRNLVDVLKVSSILTLLHAMQVGSLPPYSTYITLYYIYERKKERSSHM
jgi:hypothetical protein